VTYDTGLYSARRRTEQNSPVKWPDNGLYHSGLFSNQGQQFFSSARDLPRTNQPTDLVDVIISFSWRSRCRWRRQSPYVYHGTPLRSAPRGPTSLLLTIER